MKKDTAMMKHTDYDEISRHPDFAEPPSWSKEKKESAPRAGTRERAGTPPNA